MWYGRKRQMLTEQPGHLKHRSSVISEISICQRKIMTKKWQRNPWKDGEKREAEWHGGQAHWGRLIVQPDGMTKRWPVHVHAHTPHRKANGCSTFTCTAKCGGLHHTTQWPCTNELATSFANLLFLVGWWSTAVIVLMRDEWIMIFAALKLGVEVGHNIQFIVRVVFISHIQTK